jgi:hypothetical protein
MQVSFRLRDGLLPLVGADGADFGEQRVLAHLHSPTLHRPMRQEAQHPQGGRAQNVHRGADAFEGFQQLVRPAGGYPSRSRRTSRAIPR